MQVHGVIWGGGRVEVIVENNQVKDLAGQVFGGLFLGD